jgi:hypothetical protein
MRPFLYGLAGLMISLILIRLLSTSYYDVIHIILPSIIICGCTGAIVSAIKSEKEKTTTKENTNETIE